MINDTKNSDDKSIVINCDYFKSDTETNKEEKKMIIDDEWCKMMMMIDDDDIVWRKHSFIHPSIHS